MHDLVVSDAARADFYGIAEFGAERYGPKTAADYVDSFAATFDLLCRHPGLGRSRDELASGLRSRRHGSHIAYYRVEGDAVLIVRVMHAVADIAEAFR